MLSGISQMSRPDKMRQAGSNKPVEQFDTDQY